MIISDGGLTGNKASVSPQGRLKTSAVTLSQSEREAFIGDKFNINTGSITLTNATETTLMYIKNNADLDFVISTFIYNLGNTTGGSGDITANVIRQPTAGDIITNANNVDVVSNLNFGSSKTASLDAYKGASGESVVTDGDVSISTISPSPTGRIAITNATLVMPKGTTLAVNYTPPTSNTSQVVQIVASGYFTDEEV